MADCIDCGMEIPQTRDGTTICVSCVNKRVDDLVKAGKWDELRALAMVGRDAINDDISGHTKTRGKRELKGKYEKYLVESKNKI